MKRLLKISILISLIYSYLETNHFKNKLSGLWEPYHNLFGASGRHRSRL